MRLQRVPEGVAPGTQYAGKPAVHHVQRELIVGDRNGNGLRGDVGVGEERFQRAKFRCQRLVKRQQLDLAVAEEVVFSGGEQFDKPAVFQKQCFLILVDNDYFHGRQTS